MFLRCTEMTLTFQTKKQVQSPPALPSSYQKASRVFFNKIDPEKALPTLNVFEQIHFMLSTGHYLVLGRSRAVVFKGKDVAAPLALMRGLMNLVLQVNA